MARSPAFSAATEQARLQAVIAAAGSGAKLWVYAGTQPGGPDTASHGQTLLAGPFVFGSPLGYAYASSPPTLTIDCANVLPVIPAATGTPTWFRLTDSTGSDGSVGVMDGSAGVSGSFDLIVPTIIGGRPIGIKSWQILAHETRASGVIVLVESVDVMAAAGNSVIPATKGVTNQRTGAFYAGDDGISNAVAAAANGDVLVVRAGTYTFGKAYVARSVTLSAENPASRPVLQTNSQYDRFIDIAQNISLTIENIVLSGTKKGDGNIFPSPNNERNAIYHQGPDPTGSYTLTLRGCKVAGWGHGIMCGNHDNGHVLLENCEFDDNGNNSGMTHHIYCQTNTLTVRGCWFHNTKDRAYYQATYGNGGMVSWGHFIKTRANTTLIEASRITHEVGENNRCVDAPNGGNVTIRGCLMEMNQGNPGNLQIYTSGGSFINYGTEEKAGLDPIYLTSHSFSFKQNTLVNHMTATFDCQFMRMRPNHLINGITSWSVVDNVLAGFLANPLTVYSENTPVEGDIYQPSATDNTIISQANLTASIPSHATFDFTLATPVAGSQNWCALYYAHPTATSARTDAFRGGVPSGTYINGVWTPLKDANGVITAASWADLPLNVVVEWSGTAFEDQLSEPFGITSGTFRDLNPAPYGTRSIFDADSGGEMDKATGRMWVMGGGHGDGSNNGLYQFDCRKGVWSVTISPTQQELWPPAYAAWGHTSADQHQIVPYASGNSYGYFPAEETPAGDNKPAVMHTYRGLVYCNGELVRLRNYGSRNGSRYYMQASVDALTPSWSFGGTQAGVDPVNQHGISYNGIVYWGAGSSGYNRRVCKYNPVTKAEVGTFAIPTAVGLTNIAYFAGEGTFSAPMPGGKWFLALPHGYQVTAQYCVLDLVTSGVYTYGTLTGAVPGNDMSNYADGLCADYVDAPGSANHGKIVLLSQWAFANSAYQQVWTLIDPTTGVCNGTTITDPFNKTGAAQGNAVPANYTRPRINGRMRYWPEKKVVVWLARTFTNAIVVRLG